MSDYARFWIIYNYGGIYFDTDVEVMASLDEIINDGESIEVKCQFCNQAYEFTVEELEELRKGISIKSSIKKGSENAKSISRRNMCTKCYNSYKTISDWVNEQPLD